MDNTASTTPTHGLSISIYGRGDPTLGDTPSHTGITIYELGASTCTMYHIRNPSDTQFIYDPRPQPLSDPVLRGRCELTLLTPESKDRAAQLLTTFGDNPAHIPEYGVGNCQDWVADAVHILETEGVLDTPGEGRFWRSMVNKSAEGMRESCLRTGRVWIPGPESTFEGEPDARFLDPTGIATGEVGRLAHNAVFQARMQALWGVTLGKGSGGEEDGGIADDAAAVGGGASERPFYVSSPFLSRSHERG